MANSSIDPALQGMFDEIKAMLATQHGSALWHVLTALRGPDAPSETSAQSPVEMKRTYEMRRARKRRTGEVIRGFSFPGQGGARYRQDIDYVTLPPAKYWDHYDRHVVKAAHVLGLVIKEDPALIPQRPKKESCVKVDLTKELKDQLLLNPSSAAPLKADQSLYEMKHADFVAAKAKSAVLHPKVLTYIFENGKYSCM